MTDEIGPATPGPSEPTPQPTAPTGPSPTDAWNDVVANMTKLGDAVAAWARAAADDPETKRHLDQVRDSLNDMSAKAAETVSEVAHSDLGKSVSESATQAGQAVGDAAQQVGQAAAPHVAAAFAGLADVFGKAATKVSESTAAQSTPAPAPEAPATPASPAPPAEGEGE